MRAGVVDGEVDLHVGEAARLLGGVHVLQLDEGGGVCAEAVLFDVEGHEDAVHEADDVVRLHAVEDVVREGEQQFAPHAMGLVQYANFIYFVSAYHSFLYSRDSRPDGVQSLFDVLIPPVYLLDVVYAADTVGAQGGDEQGDAGADVR